MAMAGVWCSRYLGSMRQTVSILGMATALSAACAQACAAQAIDSVTKTGGLSVGLSGLRSADGTTVVADVMWVGADMMDGIGIRFLRQGLAPQSHGYAAMIVIGGPPRDSIRWLRIDFGLGYVGQQSDASLKFYERHGLGAQLATTIAPVRFGILRPELNGWAVIGTSARFLGASLGVRILDPRQR